MPSRRSHTKSHHGCVSCKLKRVKCNEQRPVCSTCHKFDRQCVYTSVSSQPSGHYVFQATLPSHSSRSSRPSLSAISTSHRRSIASNQSPQVSSHRSTIINQKQGLSPQITLKLPFSLPANAEFFLQHYNTVASLDLALPPHLRRPPRSLPPNAPPGPTPGFHNWEPSIRTHAASTPFLFYGILSFSALHLAIFSPFQSQKQYMIWAALAYQTLAMNQLRDALKDLTEKNCEAALALSGLLIMSTYGLQIASDSLNSAKGKVENRTSEAEWQVVLPCLEKIFALFRGTIYLYRLGYRESLDRNLAHKLRTSTQLVDSSAPEDETPGESSLSLLLEEKINTMEDGCSKDMYAEMANKMKKGLRRIHLVPGIPLPADVPKGYVEKLRQRDGVALVLLAHWAVGLHGVGWSWWTRGWGRRVVGIADELLCADKEGEEEWGELLEWPRRMVEVEVYVRG